MEACDDVLRQITEHCQCLEADEGRYWNNFNLKGRTKANSGKCRAIYSPPPFIILLFKVYLLEVCYALKR